MSRSNIFDRPFFITSSLHVTSTPDVIHVRGPAADGRRLELTFFSLGSFLAWVDQLDCHWCSTTAVRRSQTMEV
jgi:hypothetical protein